MAAPEDEGAPVPGVNPSPARHLSHAQSSQSILDNLAALEEILRSGAPSVQARAPEWLQTLEDARQLLHDSPLPCTAVKVDRCVMARISVRNWAGLGSASAVVGGAGLWHSSSIG